MNSCKFLKLLGDWLIALPFVKKWFVSEQPSEQSNRVDNADIISYDTYADDGYIVFFNMTTEEIAETKAEWQEQVTKLADGQTMFWNDTKAITRIVYPIDPEIAEGVSGSTLRIWGE